MFRDQEVVSTVNRPQNSNKEPADPVSRTTITKTTP